MNKIKEAVGVASSEGGPQAPADAKRDQPSAPNKMEDALEEGKSSKQSIDKPTDVAGRKDKGMGLADKLTGSTGDQKTTSGPGGDKIGA